MLDLRKLEIFAAVFEEGSFSAAGERLYLTQAGVSQHIHELEARLGVKLFERGRRGVQPTPAAETLHRYAVQILTLVTEAEHALTDVEHMSGGALAIGATPGASVYLLPDIVSGFRARYPQITVTVQTSTTPQILDLLRGHRLEIGCIEGELQQEVQADIEALQLDEFEQYVVVGRQHPWWGRERVNVQELNGQGMVTRQQHSQTRIWLDQTLAEQRVRPRINAEFDNVESIKRAVAAGTCLAILPAYVFEQEELLGLLWRVPVENTTFRRVLKLIWRRTTGLNPITKAFVQFVRGSYSSMAAEIPQE